MASHSSQPAQRPGPCSSVVSSSVDKVGWEGSGTRHDDCRDSANSSQTDIARADGDHSSKPLRSRGPAGNGSSGRRRACASRRIDGAATSAVAAQPNGRVWAASVARARQLTTGTAHRTNCPRGAGVGSAVTFRSLRPGVAVVMVRRLLPRPHDGDHRNSSRNTFTEHRDQGRNPPAVLFRRAVALRNTKPPSDFQQWESIRPHGEVGLSQEWLRDSCWLWSRRCRLPDPRR
jgi:hypothetical protein